LFRTEQTLACTAGSLHVEVARILTARGRIAVARHERSVDAMRQGRLAKCIGEKMDTNTLLIIVLVVLVLGGGGFFFSRRA